MFNDAPLIASTPRAYFSSAVKRIGPDVYPRSIRKNRSAPLASLRITKEKKERNRFETEIKKMFALRFYIKPMRICIYAVKHVRLILEIAFF